MKTTMAAPSMNRVKTDTPKKTAELSKASFINCEDKEDDIQGAKLLKITVFLRKGYLSVLH
jgi:hypothetical protein